MKDVKEKNYKSFRAAMLEYGHDISDLTDNQITQGIVEFGKRLECTGISMEQASNKMNAIRPGGLHQG